MASQVHGLAGTAWFKSSYSGGSGTECVEATFLDDGGAAVRDSKDPDGPVLRFSAGAWMQFIRSVREGVVA
ncbi:DUF397 domain-containing protein [Streptomyces sp. H39-S7]|uniref:DUF397 domain-containing protein n=1 Tax=Streptomyces sp. H39-S7 TaxID=3004357 RepID=UPI0022AF140E|nr:DUF397 domain-containing protein [Streptomyces sp. H39-S7]MCZ4125074.1 DUF397 domain-containing protein [Streptomyces sp. H39-S7]